MKYIIRDCETNGQSPIGGKARGLAALTATGILACRHGQEGRAHVVIPRWFALTADAFDQSLSAAQHNALRMPLEPAAIRELVEQVHLNADIRAELDRALGELCPHRESVAVRSSALDEDGCRHSFAGQFESFLSVPVDAVAAKIEAVWHSGFSDRVLAYRLQHGLGLMPCAPAVLIQHMVRADTSGVAFGMDPATARRGVAVVCAVRGLGNNLVAGACDADTYHVDREGGIHNAAHTSGTRILDHHQVRAVAELVLSAGRCLGRPQDIEWAFEGRQLYLLQARPITTPAVVPDPDGAVCLWDNSNITESYNGVTTPLTFSFARRAYEEVYRQFCRLLGVPANVLANNDNTFRNMLGLIRGRVYYNLLNWYRALALLPGFTFNQHFMEQMMGVKEPLPESIVAQLGQASWRNRLSDGLNLVASLGALLASHWTLDRRKRRFLHRLDEALGPSNRGRPDLSRWRTDELADYYRGLERKLLPHWDAPLVNDFLCMIFFGLLRKCVAKWCPDSSGNLQNDLLSSEGSIISAEPAAAIRAMADTARSDPELVQSLCEDSPTHILKAMARLPSFGQQFNAYLDKFGDRCLEELKLESPTLSDDPMLLWRSVGHLAKTQRPECTRQEPASRRRDAEQRIHQAIRFHPLRRILFWWILRNTRARVRDRENLRFERTRLFARARQIFIEFGRRLQEINRLDDPRDVFYLEVNEILGFVEGTATCTDLRALAALRKKELADYRQMEPPDSRFQTRGAVHQGNTFQNETHAENDVAEKRQGLGCCAGIVRGKVRVITDPRSAVLHPGEILVAERTDPGWILLFPAAAGLVVQRGSLLSHSAIIARELAIPAVVSLPDAIAWLKDGDCVELDGSLGVVTRIARAEDSAHGH